MSSRAALVLTTMVAIAWWIGAHGGVALLWHLVVLVAVLWLAACLLALGLLAILVFIVVVLDVAEEGVQ